MGLGHCCLGRALCAGTYVGNLVINHCSQRSFFLVATYFGRQWTSRLAKSTAEVHCIGSSGLFYGGIVDGGVERRRPPIKSLAL